MKIPLLISLAVLSLRPCLAEDVTLPKNTVMRVDRSLTSLKAGTVVTIVARGDKTITISYNGKTGTIPTNSLPGASTPAAVRTPATTAAAAPATATTAPGTAPAAKPAAKSLVADNPQSTYGNLVKKAETNAAKHEATLVKPANEVTDDSPQK
jgi:hypothetical protein